MRPQNEIAKGTNRHIPRCDLYLALMVDQSGGETVKFYLTLQIHKCIKTHSSKTGRLY